ncbi:MAG TPA: VWA domain-containing protein [Acidobacteriaceae bacterium]|nr:VWA domain-containing protein [Acidobacteriaceae bacterium]
MSGFRALFGARALRIALPAFILSFGVTILPAQETQPLAPKADPHATTTATASPITTNVDEVGLDLLIRTKRGKPVTDLRSSDLVVTDNGVPVKLSDFRLVTGAPGTQRLVTILLDRLQPGPGKATRELAARMLAAFPAEGYTFAVFQMSGRLRLLQPWTSNHQQVLEAITAATRTPIAERSSELTPAEKQLFASTQDDSLSAEFENRNRAHLLVSALEDSQRILEDQHAFPSLAVLQAIARTQRQITGRKLVIYFAEGLSANGDSRDAVASLVGQANRAGVTICAVDTNAMDQQVGDRMMSAMAMASAGPGGAFSSADSLAVHGYGRDQSGPPAGTLLGAAQNMTNLEFDSMETVKSPLIKLSSATGGIYLRAGASTRRPLQELHDDLTSYYEASYVPNIKEYNGAFHPIAVRTERKGIVVRTRAGYFALPPDNGSGLRPFEVPLLSILTQPNLPTALDFRTAVLHLGQLPDGNSAALVVQVPVSQLRVHEDANTHLSSIHAIVVSQIKNEKGAVVDRFSEDIPLHEAPDVLRSPAGQFLTMQRHFSAGPGNYTLETVVFDGIAQKAGAQRTTFSIEPGSHGPALSDIALVRTIEPLHADTASFEPMRYINGRIVPDLTSVLPENARNLSVFFLVHPLPPSAGQPQLEMQIFRNGESLGKMPLELHKTEGLGAVPYLGTIGGHAFPPGHYKVVATLTQGGQTATSSAEFSVEGTIAATMASTQAAFSATSGTAENAEQLNAEQRDTANAALTNSKFAISSPSNPVPPPTEAQIHDMIEGARQRALSWSDSLPNFMCLEVTDHSIDSRGEGEWQHKNTMVQLMRYLDHQESRTTLELDGQKTQESISGQATALPTDVDFAHSNGEFGGMFQAVFAPSAHAKFAWKESDVLNGQPVQVFSYTVDAAHSSFDVTGLNNSQHVVAFHGEVYLDAATHSIRRITINADDIPEALHVRATSISVDYEWVTINNHDYLMPSRGAVSLREGRHQAVLNAFEFRNYRRFGSQVRILPGPPRTASNGGSGTP